MGALALALSAAGASRAVCAQAAGRVFRIGFLVTGEPPAQGEGVAVAQMLARLGEQGFVAGRNLQVDVRYGGRLAEPLDRAAAELVALRPDVIVAVLTPAALAARRATSRVPIVMAGAGDPVGTGLIASLARPGGNVTGLAAAGPALAAKNLELVRDWVPQARHVAVLAHATDPFTRPFVAELERAAALLQLQLTVERVIDAAPFAALFAGWSRQGVDAVLVQPSLPLEPAAMLARRHRLRSCSFVRAYVVAGGLYAYATDQADLYDKAAGYVRRILEGADAAELPVEEPMRLRLSIHRGTAMLLGLGIPQSLLLRADEVIE